MVDQSDVVEGARAAAIGTVHVLSASAARGGAQQQSGGRADVVEGRAGGRAPTSSPSISIRASARVAARLPSSTPGLRSVLRRSLTCTSYNRTHRWTINCKHYSRIEYNRTGRERLDLIKVMEGVRVLEVAQFTFVPAAGAILADWGADVIKVEHPVRGDTQRGFINMGGFQLDPNRHPLIEHPQPRQAQRRHRRARPPDGQEVLYEIAKTADVFLTNYMPAQRQKNKFDVEHIRAAEPEHHLRARQRLRRQGAWNATPAASTARRSGRAAASAMR